MRVNLCKSAQVRAFLCVSTYNDRDKAIFLIDAVY